MTAEATVTARDTKATILDEYHRALDRINELESQRFDPAKVKEKEANTQAIAQVTNQKTDDLNASFLNLRRTINDSLHATQSMMDAKREEIEQFTRAKTALETELEQLYGITAEAQSLAALIEAQKIRKAEFEIQMAEAREQRAKEHQEHALALEAERDEIDARHKRLQEEWDYDFKRQSQAKTDKVNDDLQAKMKEHNGLIEAEYKQLEARKEELEKHEKELEDLRAWFAEAPAKLEEAEATGRKKAAQGHQIELAAIKRNHEADIRVLQHENEHIKATNAQLLSQVVALETKLEAAYEKIQAVAAKALDSQGNVLAMSEVQRAVAATAHSKKS